MERITLANASPSVNEIETGRRKLAREEDLGELRTLTELELGLAGGGDDVPVW